MIQSIFCPEMGERKERFLVEKAGLLGDFDAYALQLAETWQQNLLGSVSLKNIFHIHIPKTAGTLLDFNIKLNSQASNVFEFNGDINQLNDVLAVPDRIPASHVVGHVPFGVASKFEGSYSYLALARDPYQRLLSEYFYMVGAGADSYSRSMREVNAGLGYFLSNIKAWQINPMAKYFAGMHPDSDADDLEVARMATENMGQMWAVVPTRMVLILILCIARQKMWDFLTVKPRNASSRKAASLFSSTLREGVDKFFFIDDFLYGMIERAWDHILLKLPADLWRAFAEVEAANDSLVRIDSPKPSGEGLQWPNLFEYCREVNCFSSRQEL